MYFVHDLKNRPSPSKLRRLFGDPQIREFLWFCLPALAVGLILRVLMTWQMPYGYMQFDSADFLLTAQHFLGRGVFAIHSKRTFLVPLLYLIPFLVKLPALMVIPLAQHFLGLLTVAMVGALVRLWLPSWRWFIIPVTLIVAANPNLLWFEHALMSECVYLFCVVALALAGTLYARRRTTGTFTFFLLALFFAAGARPEGRLLLGFGFFLLVLVECKSWKTMGVRLAWLTGLALVTLPLTQTGQAGQLLYASVLPLAPDESKVDPEFGRIVRPLRDQIRAQGGVNTELQSLEQKLTDMTGAYLESKGIRHPDTNAFCQKMAIEACRNRPLEVPLLALRKFLLSNKGPVSIGYREPRLRQKLFVGFKRKDQLATLAQGLVGQPLRDDAALSAFIDAHYHALTWFPYLDDTWRHLTIGTREERSSDTGDFDVPSAPMFFVFAMAGMVVVLLVPGPNQRFHVAWILSLIGLCLAVELTGVVNPRYRFIFELFCLIYAVLGPALLCWKAWEYLRPAIGAMQSVDHSPAKPLAVKVLPVARETIPGTIS